MTGALLLGRCDPGVLLLSQLVLGPPCRQPPWAACGGHGQGILLGAMHQGCHHCLLGFLQAMLRQRINCLVAVVGRQNGWGEGRVLAGPGNPLPLARPPCGHPWLDGGGDGGILQHKKATSRESAPSMQSVNSSRNLSGTRGQCPRLTTALLPPPG